MYLCFFHLYVVRGHHLTNYQLYFTTYDRHAMMTPFHSLHSTQRHWIEMWVWKQAEGSARLWVNFWRRRCCCEGLGKYEWMFASRDASRDYLNYLQSVSATFALWTLDVDIFPPSSFNEDAKFSCRWMFASFEDAASRRGEVSCGRQHRQFYLLITIGKGGRASTTGNIALGSLI